MSKEKHYTEMEIREIVVLDYFYKEAGDIEGMPVFNTEEKEKHENNLKLLLEHIKICEKCKEKYEKVTTEIESSFNNSCGSCCSNCSGCK